MRISCTVDISGALRKLKLMETEARKGIVRALNKTAITARAEAAREIRGAGYGLKIGDIKEALSIRRATATELYAVLRASGRSIPLINYAARQTSKGVTVNVQHGRKLIPHAFIVSVRGKRGVYVRTGGQANRHIKRHAKAQGKRTDNLPIKQRYGPSIPAAFANAEVQAAVKATIRERFPSVLKHELQYLGSLK